MTSKKSKLFYLFILLIGMFFVSCGDNKNTKAQNSLDFIKKEGVLRVGVFSDKPPFSYINSKGEFDGFDVYIAKRIAKDLLGDSSKIEFIPVEAAARVEFLKSRKIDLLMANFTKTKEREEVVDFAKPYMKVSLGIVSENGKIKRISQLKGKKLIVDKGTTADFYFTKNHPDIELLKYEQNTDAFLALKTRRAEALAHDNTLIFAWAKQNPPFAVGMDSIGDQDVIAPAVRKGEKEFLQWLDDEITQLTESGFMKEAYDATLRPFYGSEIKPEVVIFEK
ncbi:MULTISPECIES: cysteine ABC transporter substrate-binding protein [unclassified Helicobacter]|uniref:cysteine ABC transporter substrate-binding protein n=1 Tax=unclassified Helicobacter TaxID=2593540 RepID=UPI000CF02FFB|nr:MULTISPECIES: cysteine ABC transporter substrate-binding protein [unclassified Helicobacter]